MKPSHLDPDGAPQMVDVGDKPVTARRAVAEATVRMRPEVLATLLDAGGPKGDALVVARLAGIAAAKRTPELIPLAHPIPLDVVEIEPIADRDAGTLTFRAEVRATARTGVEMEALTAAAVAALAVYDMAKALQRDIVIEHVRLLEKSGGRSGDYRAAEAPAPAPEPPLAVAAPPEAVVVVVSTRAAAGTRPDTVGPQLVGRLAAEGWTVSPEPIVIADDESNLGRLLGELADRGYRLILTTGGTGLTPTDRTPEATNRAADRLVPGLAELMRSAGLASTPQAALSRGVVAVRAATLIVNLPGSPAGAMESLEAVLPVLRHASDQLRGGDHH
ncbi:MAG: bifunctional molybdenum cofactor biosynthesis protein MoaC/MoaB [Chloroflexota bacterium]